MKNLFYLLFFATLLASFGGCGGNGVDEAWRSANTNAYDSIAKLPSYHALQTADKTGPEGVYYKVIQKGTGTVYPLQTSTVKVLYYGTFYDQKTYFDIGTSQSNAPATFSLAGNSTIRGFSFALQNMVVGDKWEIWIPYYLGYGAAGLTNSSYQTVIQGYTTLVFTVELVDITLYPK